MIKTSPCVFLRKLKRSKFAHSYAKIKLEKMKNKQKLILFSPSIKVFLFMPTNYDKRDTKTHFK